MAFNGGKNDVVRAVKEVDGVGVIVDAVEEVIVHRGAVTIGGKSATRGVTPGV